MLATYHPNSIASQFDAIQARAALWTFQTLLEWSMNAVNNAYSAGALTKPTYDRASRQLCTAARKGREAILYFLWNWYAGATLAAEREMEREVEEREYSLATTMSRAYEQVRPEQV